MDAYCKLGLESVREDVHAIEEMEEESFDELMDWFVQWQLSQYDHDDELTRDDTAHPEE